MSTLERAIVIAANGHAGVKDKAGAPYILHPLRMMLSLSSLDERIVAVLHDVCEDCEGWTLGREGVVQMLLRCLFFCGLTLAVTITLGSARSQSPNGVKTLNPPGAISTGSDTWSVGARAGDFIFVAGMQGVDPASKKLVDGDEARIRQAFLNLKLIADSEGATLQDCVRITVYVSDLHRFAPLVSKVQAELWGKPPYPPRTMFEVQRLFDDDIVEIDSIFYAPKNK